MTKKRAFKIFLTLIFIAACACCLYWLKGHSAPQLIGQAFFKVNTTEKIIALTFDDGPSPIFTPQILDILKKHIIKATFFVLGEKAQKYPELLKRIYEEGHEIGNHSWSHRRLIFKSPSFIRREILETDRIIREAGYKGPIHFRAPYGNKLIILPWILKTMDRPHILFDIIPKDWELPSPHLISQRVMDELHPGAIILLHDGDGDRSNAVTALDGLIADINKRGYKFLKITDLLREHNEK